MKEQIYNFNDSPLRVKYTDNDEIWFSAIDVCNVLEYQNAVDILAKKIDDDEKKLDYLFDRSGQKRKTWTINEAGLYSLIITSDKSEAKVFKRWVTHEVLPTIRKAGKYSSDEELERDKQLQELAKIIEDLRGRRETHQKAVNDIKKEIEQRTGEMIGIIRADRRQLRLPFQSLEPAAAPSSEPDDSEFI